VGFAHLLLVSLRFFPFLFVTFQTKGLRMFKITLVFAQGGYGWTESYVIQVSGLTVAQVFAAYATPIILRRLPMTGQDTTITYCRVSKIGSTFVAQAFYVNQVGTYAVASADQNIALLMKWAPGTTNPEKNMYFRGVPYTILGPGGTLLNPLPAAFRTAFNAWSSFLMGTPGAAMGWQGNVNHLVPFPLNDYSQTVGTNQIVLNFKPDSTGTGIFNNIAANTKVNLRLSGINGKSQLNGVHPVVVNGTSACTTVKPFGVIPYSYGGTGALITLGFIQLNNIQMERIMTRKAGRELFLEHGRSPVRART
jgi:hypothetical protein